MFIFWPKGECIRSANDNQEKGIISANDNREKGIISANDNWEKGTISANGQRLTRHLHKIKHGKFKIY